MQIKLVVVLEYLYGACCDLSNIRWYACGNTEHVMVTELNNSQQQFETVATKGAGLNTLESRILKPKKFHKFLHRGKPENWFEKSVSLRNQG